MNEDIATMKIEDFGYNKITDNALTGLKDYIENILYPTYIPLKGTTRTGKENEIEVRKYWTGKPRILPFIVLSTMGKGFQEDKKNFESDDMIDEYVEEIEGRDIAFRERAVNGNIIINCTMATEDAENRIKLSDYLIDKLQSNRKAFLYRDSDGMSSSLISFTNSNFSVDNFKEISAGSNDTLTYIYFCEIAIQLNIQYNWKKQIFPGVVTAIDYTGTLLPPPPFPQPVPPSPYPPVLTLIPTVEYFDITAVTNTLTLQNIPEYGTELLFWNKSLQTIITNYDISGKDIVFTFNLKIGNEVIISYSYMG